MSERAPSIYAQLLEAQRALDPIGLDGRNTHGKYSFATSEAIIAECRGVLHQAGLVVRRKGFEVRDWFGLECPTKAGNREVPTAPLTCHFEVTSPDTGEVIEESFFYYVVMTSGMTADKALGAALTKSFALYLRDLLAAPRQGEDTVSRDEGHQVDPAEARRRALGALDGWARRKQLNTAGRDQAFATWAAADPECQRRHIRNVGNAPAEAIYAFMKSNAAGQAGANPGAASAAGAA